MALCTVARNLETAGIFWTGCTTREWFVGLKDKTEKRQFSSFYTQFKYYLPQSIISYDNNVSLLTFD